MKTKQTSFYLVVTLCGFLGLLSCNKNNQLSGIQPVLKANIPKSTRSFAVNTSSAYWIDAKQTRTFDSTYLLTSYNSYKLSTTTGGSTSYNWSNTSEMWADVVLMGGNSLYATALNNSNAWMANLWDYNSSIGGWLNNANLNGTSAQGPKFVDENALMGLIELDAYEATTGTAQAAWLTSAENTAYWLMYSGLWDSTYGGGFWWNSDKLYKQTMTNGMCMQLFTRLYGITGQTYYYDWAYNIKTWLEGNTYNTTTKLYVYGWNNGTKDMQSVTYDNAIMVEADLLWRTVTGDTSYLAKADTLGKHMNISLWNSTYHVYPFSTTQSYLNPTWCGWASQAMIKLYEADGNSTWLNYAQQNIDYINAKLRTSNNGYEQQCQMDGTGAISEYDAVEQGNMEHFLALLSQYR